MAGNINKYLISCEDSTVFDTDEFRDSNNFRQWLLNRNEEENEDFTPEQQSAYNFAYSLGQKMYWLRNRAEEESDKYQHRFSDSRKALPLSINAVQEVLFGEDRDPITVISRIAGNEQHIIERTVLHMRQMLRRDHQMVAVSKVQQIDQRCLIWLARQPGHNAAQKAGSRQQILGVVRTPSFDTLENRVLKDFLRRCETLAAKYLRSYKNNCTGTNYQNVQKFSSLIAFALQREEFQTVRELREVPSPNYVLMNDKYYARIWNLYLLVLDHTRFLVDVWSNRHRIFSDFCKLALAGAVLNNRLVAKGQEYTTTTLTTPDIWIEPKVNAEGRMLSKSFLSAAFCLNDSDKILLFNVHPNWMIAQGTVAAPGIRQDGVDAYICSGDGSCGVRVSIGWFPPGFNQDISFNGETPRNHLYLLRCEGVKPPSLREDHRHFLFLDELFSSPSSDDVSVGESLLRKLTAQIEKAIIKLWEISQ